MDVDLAAPFLEPVVLRATPDVVKILVVRNRQLTPPATGLELNTGDNELPCSMLSIALPELRQLGPSCRFSGYLWTNQ